MGSKEKLLVVVVAAAAVAAALPFAIIAAPTNASLAECEDHCGNVNITYPFGMDKKECYLNEDFRVQCNNSVAHLGDSNINISTIMLPEGQMRLPMFVGRACYDQSGTYLTNSSNDPYLRLAKFSVSNTKNKFVAIGCDTVASVRVKAPGLNGNVSTGCNTQCNNMNDVPNGDCSGIGCCEATIPSEVGYYSILMATYNFHRNVWSFNNCSYAFVAEEGEFTFSASYLQNFKEKTMPVVVDWTVDNKTCHEAVKDIASYACGDNTRCEERKGKGYICKCMEGYDGNPYLLDGCQDVNECEDQSLNTCKYNSKCSNTPPGNFSCICPKGYHGDGKTACVANRSRVIVIVIGFSVGTTAVFMITSWLYWIFRKRKHIKLKEKFFKQNGGLMLQQLLHKQERPNQEVTRIFTSEELQQATNNFDSNTIVGRGGNGTVYKGILEDNSLVAIKKSNKMVDESQVEQFINELIVLSQINHRNVVKLLGCCLETQVPLLVYEFISNGTLFEHIHNQSGRFHGKLV